ncbi:alpha-ketoglutarate-dependent dioxygenase AlkB [Mobilicoccus massiliensis]|uniref:alpha-ketoglutarate-dependent dioxygenase AlkB n=1 Tax=Mobilicoccus massiliensis TaxID=1522310 RepID=UPI00058B0739|nr:alpha-ketoglutarate-dependent dioxygenase AlkB [Mobilicoccus massiliensis]
MFGMQGSLLDDIDEIGLRPLEPTRTPLADGAWVDVCPGWLTGVGDVFAHLSQAVEWRAERRWMYEREVDTPRLLRFYAEGEALPHPVLEHARDALSRHYTRELGEPFTTAGMCLYRDGNDSVAWHGDTLGRSSTHDTMVAIVSLGAPRPLLLRPASERAKREHQRSGHGGSLRFHVGHGDLVVMGGSCQRTWQHAVPKLTGSVGPRISVQFRPHDVR